MPRVIFSTHAYVYVMSDQNGRHKIGMSANPYQRRDQLQKSEGVQIEVLHGVELERGAGSQVERLAHSYLSDRRARPKTDWFYVSSVEAIEAVNAAAAAYAKGERFLSATERFRARAAERRSRAPVPSAPVVTVSTTLAECALKRIDDWRRNQRPIPNRAAAIRHFLLCGLAAESGVSLEKNQ